MTNVKIHPSWNEVLSPYFQKEDFVALSDFVRAEYKRHRIYPPGSQLFAAFEACPWEKLQVVIMGQDPYHGAGQAHGLSFSVPEGMPLPPSLQNIFKEIERDLGSSPPANGSLLRWAKQGVLLLNAVLSVVESLPHSHRDKGWEGFTDHVIEQISTRQTHKVFMLWGSHAQRKGKHIDRKKHLVLESSHPSPLSVDRGFSGCGHFSAANQYLESQGHAPIQW